ncbi:hypothetical protein ID866_3405 [Astraeus odoratus]|nr:hypothetical protein ID866_3405 [Astraeus odoratus]
MQAVASEAEVHFYPPPPLVAKAISAAATASVVIASMSMPTSRQQSISVCHRVCPTKDVMLMSVFQLVEMLPFASSLCILAALATGSFALQNSASIASVADVSKSRMYSSAISSIIAAVTPMLALIYFCPLYLLYRHSKRNPRPLNKMSGMRMQQYGPFVYVFLLFSSLAGVADATWLLLQYKFNDNAPNPTLRSGVKFLLFAGCWTTITSVASIGTQAVWVLVTWVFWVAGAGLLNSSSRLFTTFSCEGVVYCGQLKALFALSVIEIATLTFGMIVIGCTGW